jgi:DinB family protein
MKTNPDKALRQHLLYLLKEGGAHAMFEDAIKDFPAKLRGQKVSNFPHTAWMLLEHMRIAQRDILDFSRNPKHKSPKWPEGYWPKTDAAPTPAAWTKSIADFRKDSKAMEALITNPKTDLYAPLPWADGQTVLREALLVADHNAYHLGQLVTLRRLLGAWNE